MLSIRSRAAFLYSPQLVVLLSSRKPVSIVSHVRIRIPVWAGFRGTKRMQRIAKIVMNTEPAPVGFPFATSAVSVNSRPLS